MARETRKWQGQDHQLRADGVRSHRSFASSVTRWAVSFTSGVCWLATQAPDRLMPLRTRQGTTTRAMIASNTIQLSARGGMITTKAIAAT